MLDTSVFCSTAIRAVQSEPISFIDITTLLPFFLSMFTLYISYRTLAVSQRNLITETISVNRVNWISSVRKLIYNFLCEYKGERRSNELIKIYTEITLYCNPKHNTYSNLIESMKKCILSQRYDDSLYWAVLENGQCVLDASWVRMKFEAGITHSGESKIPKILEKECCDKCIMKWHTSINSSQAQESEEL